MNQLELKTLFLLWQWGLVDSYIILTNLLTQWGGISLGGATIGARNATALAI